MIINNRRYKSQMN